MNKKILCIILSFICYGQNINSYLNNLFSVFNYKEPILDVVGEYHTPTSITQFLHNRSYLEADHYLVELPPDLDSAIIKENRKKNLPSYLAYYYPKKARLIDMPTSSEYIGLNFSLNTLFNRILKNESTESDNKTVALFLNALGTLEQFNKKYTESLKILRQIYEIKELFATEGADRTKLHLKQAIDAHGVDELISALRLTPVGIRLREEMLASNIVAQFPQGKALCVIGTDHLTRVHQLVLTKTLLSGYSVGPVQSYPRDAQDSIKPVNQGINFRASV